MVPETLAANTVDGYFPTVFIHAVRNSKVQAFADELARLGRAGSDVKTHVIF